MATMMIEALGLLAGVIGIVAWIPQIIQVWVHKRHDGLSLTTFGVVAIALSLWLVYGILVDSFAMVAANIMTLSVIGAVFIGVIRVRRSEDKSEIRDQL
ncbi:MAG: PQ-loop domain-containing transporter [Candidatus Poseidoniaceae archaeon]|nr:PQ-loop domain-containing transporter [Candidatus Poseidoniaceae archaeon]